METKVMVVGSAKTQDINHRSPRIRLSGNYLDELGFEHESLVTASCHNNSITLKLEGKGMDTYNRIVKGLLGSGSRLLQVRNQKNNKRVVPHLDIKGYWMEDIGFKIGSVIVVRSVQGEINIKALELDELE